MKNAVRAVSFALSLALSFAVPFSSPAEAAGKGPLHVVASFSILGDITQTIGGRLVEVKTLVPPDGDAHHYQPTPDDAKALAAADLVIVNGLGFEPWMSGLLESAGYKGKVVTASRGVDPRILVVGDDKESRENGVQQQVTDPHAWQNPLNGRLYAANIAMAIATGAPDRADAILVRADKYQSELTAIDKAIRAAFEQIPVARRVIVTSHDAFGYYGDAYSIRFVAPYGMSEESEPSAAAIKGLIAQIKSEGVKDVFIENMTNPKLIAQLAHDGGAVVGGTLYSDALSPPGGPAPTYLEMLKYNLLPLKAAMLRNNPK